MSVASQILKKQQEEFIKRNGLGAVPLASLEPARYSATISPSKSGQQAFQETQPVNQVQQPAETPKLQAGAEIGKQQPKPVSKETLALINQQKSSLSIAGAIIGVNDFLKSGMKTVGEVGTYIGNYLSSISPTQDIAQWRKKNTELANKIGMPSQVAMNIEARTTQLTSSGFASGLTGGIVKSDQITPQNWGEKVVQSGASLYGFYFGMKGISGATNALGLTKASEKIGQSAINILGNSEKVANYLTKYPSVSNAIKSLVKSGIDFNIYTQLNPDIQDRIGTAISTTLLTPVYSAQQSIAGFTKVPAGFILGTALAKLEGASWEDSLISGALFAGMEGAGLATNQPGKKMITTERANNILKSASIDVLNKYSNVKISEVSSKAEIKQAYLDAFKNNAPDRGGNEKIAASINEAYKNLNPRPQSYDPNIFTPKSNKSNSLDIDDTVVFERAIKASEQNQPLAEQAIKSGQITPAYKKQTILQNSIKNYQEQNRSLVVERNTNQSQLQIFTFDSEKGQQYSIKYTDPNTNIETQFTGKFKTKEEAITAGKTKAIEILQNEFQRGNKDAKNSIALILLDKKPLDTEIKNGQIPTTLKNLDNTQKLLELVDEAKKPEAMQIWKKDYQLKYSDLITKFKDKIDKISGGELKPDKIVISSTKKLSDQLSKIENDFVNKYQPETKPVKEVKPETTKKQPLEPVGEGKTLKSKSAQKIAAKAIEEGLAKRFKDMPEYKQMNRKEQAERATKLLFDDYQYALDIAMGKENPPKGLTPEAVQLAVEEKAIMDKDVNVLREIVRNSTLSKEATAMGQRISMLAERDPYSPLTKIKEVQDSREKSFEKMKKKTVKEAVKEEKNKIKEEIKKSKPKFQDYYDFIDKITC